MPLSCQFYHLTLAVARFACCLITPLITAAKLATCSSCLITISFSSASRELHSMVTSMLHCGAHLKGIRKTKNIARIQQVLTFGPEFVGLLLYESYYSSSEVSILPQQHTHTPPPPPPPTHTHTCCKNASNALRAIFLFSLLLCAVHVVIALYMCYKDE